MAGRNPRAKKEFCGLINDQCRDIILLSRLLLLLIIIATTPAIDKLHKEVRPPCNNLTVCSFALIKDGKEILELFIDTTLKI